MEHTARITRLPAASYFHPPVFLFTARQCQPPARAPRSPRGAGHGPPAHQGGQQEGLGGLQAHKQLSLPEGTQGVQRSRGLGAYDTMLSVLVLQKPLPNPELGAGMGRGLCLAGAVSVDPPSQCFPEGDSSLPNQAVSPQPVGSWPGPWAGDWSPQKGKSCGGNLWDAASLAGPGPSLPAGSVHPAGGREGNGGNSQTAFKGKSYYGGKKCLRGQTAPGQRQAGQEAPRLWGGDGQAGCGQPWEAPRPGGFAAWSGRWQVPAWDGAGRGWLGGTQGRDTGQGCGTKMQHLSPPLLQTPRSPSSGRWPTSGWGKPCASCARSSTSTHCSTPWRP